MWVGIAHPKIVANRLQFRKTMQRRSYHELELEFYIVAYQ